PKMITEAQDVTYDGSYTKTYDGQAASVADIKDPTWTVKGLVNSDKYDHSGLTNEDFNWMKDGQPISGPEAGVGKYVLTLNQHGLDKLNQQNPNYQVDESALSGQYTYTITPLTVVTVNYKGYDKKVYDGRPGVINLDKLVWDELPDGTNLNLSGLTSAYFSWDTPNHEAPTEVGRYTISLTKQGEDLLQSENPNYNFIKFTGTFIYDITPMAEVTVTYNGADGKIYDGQPGTINPAKLTWSKLPDGTSLKMPTWSAGDFAWDTADGLAPTAVGTYQIKLTDAGKAALKKANPNYDLSSITGVFTYEIKPAQTPETPGQTPEQQPGQTPEQQPDQNTNQSGTSENGFGPSARPNASTNSNASQLPQTGNDHSNTALAGLALASLIAMLGLGKKRKHD
ncbi:MBG domain-containing protein, partial [Limosilactobacillus reuteri]|uniref:MBG domain-containing protein n=1 Tax=Limosilactobacillus reuteri TaxID=1598 RepID=UPI001F4E762F